MNSLNKLKVDKDYVKIAKWLKNFKYEEENMYFVSAKLDGVSIQVILKLG